jgi:uncharacterized protein (DUF1697 family)
MPRHIAFLRAINVGGHVVKMEKLRALFSAMKFRNVETFIASGNVIFDSPSTDAAALEARIEQALEEALGYEVATFIRSPEALAAIAARSPFGAKAEADAHTVSVAFLKSACGAAESRRVLALASDVDDFRVVEREVYWLRTVPFNESKVQGNRFEKALGQSATARNVTTVRKIAAKYRA